MSKIDRVSIRGIRSFDPDDKIQLEFGTPLTMIVGLNGTGKTTIIECLKYITTGEFPPNAKGATFVHDPKLTGFSSVRAQVQLKFTNVNSQKIVATRSMEVTQKKTKATFKTIESGLLIENNVMNQIETFSTKCSDLDRDVPLQLGVSKPILEHVVFCHQEDSNWPFADNTSIKKRFDEIFDATKFTAALLNLKSIKKEKTIQQKHESQKLEYLMNEVKRAEKVEVRLEQLRNDQEAKQAAISELDLEIDELTLKCTNLNEMITKANDLEKEIQGFQNKIHLLTLSISNIEANFTKLSDSEEEIRQKLEKYNQDEDSYKLEQIKLKNNEKNIEFEKSRLREELTNKIAEKIKLESQLESLKNLNNKQQEFINNITKEFEIPDNLKSKPFNQVIATLLDQHQENLNTEKTKNKQSTRELTDDLNEYKNQINKIRFELEATRHKMFDKEDELENTKSELNKLEDSSKHLESIMNQVNTKTEDLIELKNKLKSFERESSQLDLQNQLSRYEAQMMSLTSVLNQNQSSTMSKVRFEILKRENKELNNSLNLIMKENEAKFQEYWGPNTDIDLITQDINQNLIYHEDKLNNTKRRYQEQFQEMSLSEVQLQNLISTLNKKKSFIDQNLPKILETCEFDKFLTIYNQINNSWETKIKEISTLKSKLEIYSHFSNDSISDDLECPLCDREFHNSDDFYNFLTRVKSQNFTLNVTISTFEKEIAETERRRLIMKNLLPLYNELSQLISVEIKELESSIKLSQFKFDRNKRDTNELQSDLQRLEAKVTELKKLDIKIQEINSLSNKLKQVQVDIDSLPRDDANNFAQSNESEFSSIQQKCSQLRTQIESRREEHSNLMRSITEIEHSLKLLQQTYEYSELQLKQQTKLKDMEKNLALEIQNLKLTMERQSSRQDEVNFDIEQIETSLKDLEKTHDENEKRLQHQLSGLNRYQSLYQSTESDINNLDTTEIMKSMEICLKEINNIDQRSHELEIELKTNNIKVNELNNLLSSMGSVKKNLQDNLDYSEFAKQLEKLKSELSAKEDELNQFNLKSTQSEMTKFNNLLNESLDKRASLNGQITQLIQEIDRNKYQLSTDYKSSIENCNQQCVLVETLDMIISDLDLYMKNLDASIVKYHTRKINEINVIIRQLWSSTYQGTDIDTIEIKTNLESDAATNRSYNYRVVMVKGDLELDMRGRCSAGQKVLASIIIRLALADAFSSQSGFLTLDEPTTNLDFENITALAESLRSIIESRLEKKNFQLVVITHDDTFIKMLGQNAFSENYYRVQKINKYSKIERFPISDL